MDYYLEELTSEGGVTIDACCPLTEDPGANGVVLLILLLPAGRLLTNRPLTLSSPLLLCSLLTLGS